MYHRLLWIDCIAAGIAGTATLALAPWLSEWYRLPPALIHLIGVTNLIYGGYSFALAVRAERPKALLVGLVLANAAWAVTCLRWALAFGDVASVFGLLHLIGEGLFVGGLAVLEWRYRNGLRTRETSPSR